MEIRLAPQRGGDGSSHGISVMNDTGSGIMSILDLDLAQLGDLTRYGGWLGPMLVMDAGGRVENLQQLLIEVRLVDDNLIPWTEWIPEITIVRRLIPGMHRLSGLNIRHHLYFANPKGNAVLAISTCKTGLYSLI